MDFKPDIIRDDETLIFKLRALYAGHGYKQFRMSRFEEYELYAANRAFLPGNDIVAFTGADGKLMALRPDVTLSIVKNIRSDGELKKLYYSENVYRTVDNELKEHMQVGLECIGALDTGQIGQVLMLAKQSLDMIHNKTRLDISHMGFLRGLINSEKFSALQKAEIMRSIGEKNIPQIKQICAIAGVSDAFCENIITLVSLSGGFSDIKGKLEKISINDETGNALRELSMIDSVLKAGGAEGGGLNVDFSIINDVTYYNGIVFQGFIEGIPSAVLSGGRYDELLEDFGKKQGAIGFAVHLNLALMPAQSRAPDDSDAKDTVGIALPKGRIGEKAYEIFARAGFECPDMNTKTRKLVFDSPGKAVRFFWVKPSDVAIYVQRGVADIGVVGKDVLLESSPDIFELIDLGIGKCRMCVAAAKESKNDAVNGSATAKSVAAAQSGADNTLRVATKFPNIARRHYRSKGRDIDIIRLHGSIELAPLLGLSDVIIDLVETGNTLAENNMEVIETIEDISARLISNKVSYKFKHENISKICGAINASMS
ncbi:MAG: ATP phosphoribosyltransferase [Oscillospiraceae bacterium]|nr:ATP phosphoribosyltransferase [Oscillospiraceae bacterium]